MTQGVPEDRAETAEWEALKKPPADTSWIKTEQIGMDLTWPWVLAIVLPFAIAIAFGIAILAGCVEAR